MRRVRQQAMLLLIAAVCGGPLALRAQIKTVTKATTTKRKLVAADSAASIREFLEADDAYYEARVFAARLRYLKRASWAALGDRCNPGSLRVFPVDTLPAQRDALHFTFYRGLSQREIAAHTGIPLGTIKTRLELALRKVRTAIVALGGMGEWAYAGA